MRVISSIFSIISFISGTWSFVPICTYDYKRNVACLYCATRISDMECSETCFSYEKHGRVVWNTTKALGKAVSDPMCLSANWEIEYRYCIARNASCFDGEINPSNCLQIEEDETATSNCWEDPPSCERIQKPIDSPCSEGMEYVKDKELCLYILNTTKFPPECPFKELVRFERYSYLKDHYVSGPIWMPVQRDIGDYGIGLLYWVEPYENFYAEFTGPQTDTGDKDKNCVIYYNASYVEFVSCDENYTAICAYETLAKKRSRNFCSQLDRSCTQSDYDTNSLCFCLRTLSADDEDSVDDSWPLAEFQLPHQSLIYQHLTQETCHIGLYRTDGTFKWAGSKKEISYSNWAEDVSFDKDNTLGVFSNEGWKLAKETADASCRIVQKFPREIDPDDLKIELDNTPTTISMSISNIRYFFSFLPIEEIYHPYVFCFTDTGINTIISKVEFQLIKIINDIATFQFSTLDTLPGYYWCESHVYPDLKKVVSNKILFRPEDEYQIEFILTVNYTYTNDPLLPSSLEKYVDKLTDEMKTSDNSNIWKFFPRIYKIIQIIPEEHLITLNFRLSCKLCDKENFTDQNLSQLILVVSSLSSFTYVDIRSTDFCIPGIAPSDTSWPRADVNTPVYPKGGYCVTNSGILVKRNCIGGFSDGATWSPIEDNYCTFYAITNNFTEALVNIIDENDPDNFTNNVNNFSCYTSSITELDVFLFGKFLSQLIAINECALEHFLQIVNNLMNIPREILKGSQEKFNATDLILTTIDNILKMSTFDYTKIDKNFAIFISDIKVSAIKGIVVEEANDSFKVTPIPAEADVIADFSNFTGAVQLSSVLYDQVTSSKYETQRLIVSIFRNDALFNEPNRKTTSIVFGVLLPDFQGDFEGPIKIIFSGNIHRANSNCSYWNFDTDHMRKGFWDNDYDQSNENKYFVCQFYHLTNFAVVSSRTLQGGPTNSETTTETITESITDSITESTTESITESTTESITESTTESITESTTESITESTTESITESTTENITESTTESITEITTKRIAENTTQSIPENITDKLEIILKASNIENELVNFEQVSYSYEKFQENDLALVSKIFERMSEEVEGYPEIFSKIVDNLFLVNNSVLRGTDEGYDSMLAILEYYKNIIMRVNTTTIFEQSNMATILSVISDIRVITVTDCRKRCLVQTYNEELSIDTNYENFEMALVFSDKVLDEINPTNSKILVMIFFKRDFFAGEENVQCIFSPVSVNFESSQLNLLHPLDVYYNTELVNKAGNDVYDCGELERGNVLWFIKLTSINYYSNENIINCKFYNEGYFALIDDNSVPDVTLELKIIYEDLVESNTIRQALISIETLSRLFWKIDIQALEVLSNIFCFLSSQVSNFDYIEMEPIVNILNNLLNVQKEILMSSNATNKILEAFANISKKCVNCADIIQTSEIILVISYLPDSLKGIAISPEFNASILDSANDFNNLNYKYAVLFDGEDETNNVIVTAFFSSDQLFLSESSSAIVLVSFANEFHADQNTTSVVFYKTSQNFQNFQRCVVYQMGDVEPWQLFCGREEKRYKNCSIGNSGYYTLFKPDQKNISVALEDILLTYETTDDILCHLSEICSFYNEFSVEDLNLLVQLLDVAMVNNRNDVLNLVHIMDKLLEIDETIWKNGSLYDSTEKMLEHILVKLSNYTDADSSYYVNYKQTNFAVSSWRPKIDEIHGCMLDSNESLSFIHNDSYTFAGKLDCAIVLSKDLVKQLKSNENDKNVVVTIYFNDKLFTRVQSQSNNKIFGLAIPKDSEDSTANNISIFYNLNNTTSTDASECATWTKSPIVSYWKSSLLTIDSPENLKQCEFQNGSHFGLIDKSLYTDLLRGLLYDGKSDTLLDDLLTVTSSYGQLVPLDIYLISEIIDTIASNSYNVNLNLTQLINVVDNLMSDVYRANLIEAQLRNQTSDRILLSIQRAVSSYNTLRSCERSLIEGERIRVSINHFNEETSVFGFADSDINITFSDELMNYIKSTMQRLILLEYKNDAFFYDATMGKKVNFVAGIIIPNIIDQYFEAPMTIRYAHDFISSSPKTCVSWEFPNTNDNESGRWILDLVSTNTNDTYPFCTFSATNINFAVMGGNFISNKLIAISETQDFLNKLSSIRKLLEDYSSHFTCSDLNFSAKILSACPEEIPYNYVENILYIVNYTIGIERICHEQSNTSDAFLILIDNFLSKHINSKQVVLQSFSKVLENIAIVIQNVNVDDTFKGIVVKNCTKSSCKQVIPKLNTATSADFNSDVAIDLELSEELITQLENHSGTIAITIFFSDILFVQHQNHMGTVSKIVSVLLPETMQQLDGPIKITFNIQPRNSMCAFWKFANFAKSYWELENKPDSGASCQFSHVTHFALVAITTITEDLESILDDQETPIIDKLVLVKNITEHQYIDLTDRDIFLISLIMLQALKNNVYNISLTSSIVSDLFLVDPEVMNDSQKSYNATDVILNCIDSIAKETYDESEEIHDYFTLLISTVKVSKIAGVILENCSDKTCDISYPTSLDIAEISSNKNINAAIAFSDELKNQIHENESARVIVSIHFKNILFNEKQSDSRQTTKVFGVILPDLKGEPAGNISFLFNTGHTLDDSCAYWNYKMNDSGLVEQEGRWAEDASKRPYQLMSICDFSHLTHFALLLLSDGNDYYEYYDSLDLITNISCSLSILGILGIIITAVSFRKWRKNTGNQILLNFSIAILLQIIMMYISGALFKEASYIACAITGAILHYSLLSEFCWMLIIAILQFKRFVEVLGGPPKYIFRKALVCGWLFPIFPVVLVLALDPDNYAQSKVGLCYPTELGLYLGVYLPVAMIVGINLVIFIFIMYNVFHKKSDYRDAANSEMLFQWRLALLLFSMLGLTWLFGFLAEITHWFLLIYLFCLTASLQGFVMFLFFIVFNKNTRFLYAQSVKYWLYNKGLKDKI